MRKAVPKKTVYYDDPLRDDFAGTSICKTQVDESFPYVRKNPIWRFFAWIVYYVIAIPLVWFYTVVLLQVKFVNRKGVRKAGKPCFLFGNHTGFIDAFTPNLISFPTRNKIVVSADTVSIKGLKTLVQMLGAIPVPTKRSGMKAFLNAVQTEAEKNNVTVYPEAHIWPYYTGVRPFESTPFAYPVRLGAPVVAFFTAYSKPKGFLSWFRKANVTVYVSDPIYPDEGLTGKQAQINLREKVYDFLLEKSSFSDYTVVEYIQRKTD